MVETWRTVRVFISSTFRDMHAERDILVRVVFPALREWLEPHRLHLVDIDLRWGITEEQAENDQAVEFCLDQIDECRPFFIGLLGERYGWVPAQLPSNTNRYNWTQQQIGKSVTELEIRWGLQEPKMQALFFYRDPSFGEDVPESKKNEIEAESVESADKLAQLKTEIRSASLSVPVEENYPCQYAGLRVNWHLVQFDLNEADQELLYQVAKDGLVSNQEYQALGERLKNIVNQYGVVYLKGLEHFGRLVFERLRNAIRAEFKLKDTPGPQTDTPEKVELDYHERFMESRLRVYIGRESLIESLFQFVESDSHEPALVTGVSGSGKSAALAKLCDQYRRSRADILVIPHFIGASPGSTSLRQSLRKFCHVLKAEFKLTGSVPPDTNSLIKTFRQFITKVPPNRRVLLVIDALNQFDEIDLAQELAWLPKESPSHVKIVISYAVNADDQTTIFQEFEHRKYTRIEVPLLTDEERFLIVKEVPSLSAKSLDHNHVKTLLDNPATASPLFLLVALEELRGFGSFEQLGRRIQSFPSGEDAIGRLFVQVIERLREEFEESTVNETLSLLAASRQGLSDRELLDIIEGSETAIDKSQSDLFPILRQLRPYLQYRGDLRDFFHHGLSQAVRQSLLSNEADLSAAHQRLANYFESQTDFSESLEAQRDRARQQPPTPRLVNLRKIAELPYHLLHVAKLLGKENSASPHWDAVADLFTKLEFLEAKAEAHMAQGAIFELVENLATVLSAMPKVHACYPILELLDESIRRDIHFINRHPTTLFQCLWNTGWWYAGKQASKPIYPESGLGSEQDHSPETELKTLLEHWQRFKFSRIPIPWVQSLRPPYANIGSRLIGLLQGHSDTVKKMAYSPDGQRLASCSVDGSIRIWDAKTSRELLYFFQGEAAQPCFVTFVDFSSDGRKLLSTQNNANTATLMRHQDASLSVWDSRNGVQESVHASGTGIYFAALFSGSADHFARRRWRESPVGALD